jgi:hypothetical protein
LALLSDMANWGHKKYLLGEVDVFKIDATHELFGHMNINYVRLDRLPRFDEGWQPVLDALKAGRFFVTTGEILIKRFQVGSRLSGQTLEVEQAANASVEFDLQWTFPLKFAEIVTGDGHSEFRQPIDLTHTTAHGSLTMAVPVNLARRYWVRLEVWDVATNGAFTQPVWILQP